jgi:uncharacterized protein DUF3800
MIEAYFDESGIHDGAKVCVVAGYYGSQSAWRTFERHWNRIIEDYPELHDCGFHATRFFKRVKGKRIGHYKDWTDDKARHFLDRLVQAVMRNRIFPISYAIVVEDFLSLPLVTRKWLTGAQFRPDGKCVTSGCPKKSYYLPFSLCILDSARMSGANPVDKIHFFAGLDRSFYRYANALYKFILVDSRLPASIKGLLGQIGYPLAKDTPGLQAADLLAYRFYRFALDKIETKTNIPTPPLLSKLIKNRKSRQRFDLFESTRLQKLETLGRQMYDELARQGRIQGYLGNPGSLKGGL